MTAPRPATLVTGASGAIGRALARVFAANGHELVLLALDEVGLVKVADEIVASGAPRPVCLVIDLTQADALASIRELLAQRNVEAAFVVNSAGIGLVGHATSLRRADQLKTIDINVRVLTELSLAFVDSLARHRGGILNVGSVAGYAPGPGMAVYYASKAYVRSFTDALHRELLPRGVRVTTLCPGILRSDFLTHAGVTESKIPDLFLDSAEQVARAGYRGLMRGRRVVVPGMIYKAIVGLFRLLPHRLLLPVMEANHRRLNRSRFGPPT
jgi:short-subunit dehydrogenase